MAGSPWREALVAFICGEAQPPDKFQHQPRLYALASTLGAGHPHDDDVLFAAAYLHDLGVFVGHRPEDLAALVAWDHIAHAIDRSSDILRGIGFPESKIQHVLEVIRTHMPQSVPASIEGELLRDADILEQLGATGILRTVSKVGRDTRFIRHADALRALRRALETLPGLIRLDATHALAAPRIAALKSFLEAAEAEGPGVEAF